MRRYISSVLFLALGLGGLVGMPQKGEALGGAGDTVHARAVEAVSKNGGASVVLRMDAPVAFTSWKLDAPRRIVLELSNAVVDASRLDGLALPSASGLVSVTLEDAPNRDRTRVVFVLKDDCHYLVTGNGPDIEVTLLPVGASSFAEQGASGLGSAATDGLSRENQRQSQELTRTRQEADARELALKKVQAAVDQRHVALLKSEAKVAARIASLEAAEAGLKQRQARLERHTQRLESQDDVLKKKALKIANASKSLAERNDALAEKEAHVDRQLGEVARQKTALMARNQALLRQSEEVRRRAQSLEQERQKLSRLDKEVTLAKQRLLDGEQALVAKVRQGRSELMRLRKDVAAKEAQARSEVGVLKAEAEQVRKREKALRVSEAMLKKDNAKMARQLDELMRRRTELGRDVQKANRALETAQAAHDAWRAKREAEKEATLSEQRTALEVQLDELRAELVEERAAHAEAVAARQRQEAEAAAAVSKAAAAKHAAKTAVAKAMAEVKAARKVAMERALKEAEMNAMEKTADSAALRRAVGASGMDKPVVSATRETWASGVPSVERRSVREPVGRRVTPRRKPRSKLIAAPLWIRRVSFVDEPGQAAVVVETETGEIPDYRIMKRGKRHLRLALEHVRLPPEEAKRLDATEYFGPVRQVATFADDGARRVFVDIRLARQSPSRLRELAGDLRWEFAKGQTLSVLPSEDRHGSKSASSTGGLVQGGFGARLGRKIDLTRGAMVAQAMGRASSSLRPRMRQKRYRGRRIDLDFKDADIHNILRLLSDVGDVNIVVSDDVKGQVTIKMRNVPWDQALDVILRSKMLGQVREGNLIRVAPLQVLEKELEQEIARQKQINDVLPTQTRLIGVSYANAADLVDRAKDLLSNRGKISVDARTNNLIVSDVSKNLALVEELVRNLDTQTSQVVIEARIVEARSTFLRQLGIQWGGSAFAGAENGNPTGLAFPSNIGIGGAADDAETVSGGWFRAKVRNWRCKPELCGEPTRPHWFGGWRWGRPYLGFDLGAFNLNLRLSAMENSGQVRILSSPRISTMDNVQASIEQGVAIPISVVSAQGVQTIFVDAKLNLTVKPHVTNEGTVILDVNVTRNEPDFVNTGARGDPTILKEAKTVMLVRDGDTAVIGGIYQRNSGFSNSKVPFLADIPVLGYLFRNSRENDDRTEFLVFITRASRTRPGPLGIDDETYCAYWIHGDR